MSSMLFLKDKLLIFIMTLSAYWYFSEDTPIIPILCTIIISGLNIYYKKPYFRLISVISYIFFCTLDSHFIYFSPVLMYDIAQNKESRLLYVLSTVCLLSAIYLEFYTFSDLLPILLMYAMSIYLKIKSTTLHNLRVLHYQSKYELEDTASFLEQKNKALLEKQNSEIRIATLNERNRIAREIHDNVGHLLSRCLLQIGALMVIAKKDDILYNGLSQIKETLTQAMNSIRSSVHDLHDESLDLETELHKIIDNFTFCHINFDYDIINAPNNDVKYSFIAIVKEALANVMKHSHATDVEVIANEHTTFYQLIIKDNDLSTSVISSSGIGLHNMEQRILSLDGQLSIDTTKGFKIFITVPKKKGNMP